MSPFAGDKKAISAQLEELLEAIRKYCAPYLAMECAAKHVRHAISLSYPRVMHTPSSDPSRLVSVGAKRKHELCGSMAATGAPARKLACQPPRLLSSSRWPRGPPGANSMPVSRATPGVSSSRWPSGPPGANSMPVSHTPLGGCAAEYNVNNVGTLSPYAVSVFVPSVVQLMKTVVSTWSLNLSIFCLCN